MRYPTLFVNHGGGPLPLLGRQPELVQHMKETVTKWLPNTKPSAIVVFSAHWETQGSVIKITSSAQPSMLYDYYGFPPETYEYKYPAPGNPNLAAKIQQLLLDKKGISSQLDPQRGYDHGVFIPLMLMYPEADIPVVQVSLDSSLSAERNMAIGSALESLRDEGVLILGSGYTFHNMQAFFHPSDHTRQQSRLFNMWLQDTLLLNNNTTVGEALPELAQWESKAPGARVCHPQEEHLLPLFMAAAAAGPNAKAKLIWSSTSENNCNDQDSDDHAVSSFLFE